MSTRQKSFKVQVKFSIYLLVTIFIATAIFLAETVSKVAAQPKTTIRIGLVGEIDPIDPNNTVNLNTETVFEHIFETLIIADQSINLQPHLAKSWEVTPDNTAIIFNLRKDVKFHDGTSFNAKAVKMTFDRMMNEKLKRWPLFSPFLKSVEVINESTIKMNLKGGAGPALTMLSVWGHIESPTAIEKYGKDIASHPVGTGPFKFVEWIPDQRVVLEANKDYWGGSPKISQVVFKPVPDPLTRLAMVEAGDLDVTWRIPYTEINRLKADLKIKVLERPTGTLFFLIFNTVKKPFNDKGVRQAISYSIDRKSIINTLLFGLVRLGETYGGPSVKHVFKYNIYPYNPEKAKSILAELGWKLGKSGFLERKGEVLRTALVTPSGRFPGDSQIAEAIQAQLKKVGIDTKIIVLESGAYIKTVMSGRQVKQNAEYGMTLQSWPMGPDPDSCFNQHFHSKSPEVSNSALYANSELDPLLEEGATAVDETKRSEIYKKVQDILNEDVPWLPIYSLVDFAIFRKGVQGVGYANPFTFLFVSKDAQVEQK
jgi:ABC-type transport system substrate-binding protein